MRTKRGSLSLRSSRGFPPPTSKQTHSTDPKGRAQGRRRRGRRSARTCTAFAAQIGRALSYLEPGGGAKNMKGAVKTRTKGSIIRDQTDLEVSHHRRRLTQLRRRGFSSRRRSVVRMDLRLVSLHKKSPQNISASRCGEQTRRTRAHDSGPTRLTWVVATATAPPSCTRDGSGSRCSWWWEATATSALRRARAAAGPAPTTRRAPRAPP